MIIRYGLEFTGYDGARMYPENEGKYILYSDYEKLEETFKYSSIHTCHDQCARLTCVQGRRITELEAELKWLNDTVNKYTLPGEIDTQDSIVMYIKKLEQQVRELNFKATNCIEALELIESDSDENGTRSISERQQDQQIARAALTKIKGDGNNARTQI